MDLINFDDNEIIALARYYKLPEDSNWQLASIINSYFLGSGLEDALNELDKVFAVEGNTAKKIIVSFGVLFYAELPEHIKEEISSLLVELNIDISELEAELNQAMGLVIDQAEAFNDFSMNEEEMELIVGKFLKDSLLSDNQEAKDNLNYRMIEELLTEGASFKEKLEKALQQNQQTIGSEKIKTSQQTLEPTIENWVKDFEAFNLNNDFEPDKKVKYLNDSENFNRLNAEDKNILRLLLDFYIRLTNFPEYFENIEIDGWYLIPVNKKSEPFKVKAEAANMSKSEKSVLDKPEAAEPGSTKLDKAQVILDAYRVGLAGLQKKYEINKGLIEYKDKSLKEIIGLLKQGSADIKLSLALLTLAVNMDKNLVELDKAGIISKKDMGKSIKEFLTKLGLDHSAGAIFVIYLAKSNKNLANLAYFDMADTQFKWR